MTTLPKIANNLFDGHILQRHQWRAMTITAPGDIKVARHLQVYLRGLRTSSDFETAEAAIRAERDLSKDLRRAARLDENQIREDEEAQAVNFALAPAGKADA